VNERWRERAEAALEGALKEHEADTEDRELAAALQRIFAKPSIASLAEHLL
jgi:hypothetical protein